MIQKQSLSISLDYLDIFLFPCSFSFLFPIQRREEFLGREDIKGEKKGKKEKGKEAQNIRNIKNPISHHHSVIFAKKIFMSYSSCSYSYSYIYIHPSRTSLPSLAHNSLREREGGKNFYFFKVGV